MDPDPMQLGIVEPATDLFCGFIKEVTSNLLIGHCREIDNGLGAGEAMAALGIGTHFIPVFVAGGGDGYL